ncbi:hypothetical protein C5689_02250 [Methylosinus sporium]|uniref:Uncharacterized protein n=1 Tax=Methylosinus sporium TaxID=428 RepID=A0A2U1SUS9_METSR|nr:hypothetical protein C5689_02250 [Methylosinus sporium]
MREAHRHDRRSVAKSERDDAPPQSAPIRRALFVDKSASVAGARIEWNHSSRNNRDGDSRITSRCLRPAFALRAIV